MTLGGDYPTNSSLCDVLNHMHPTNKCDDEDTRMLMTSLTCSASGILHVRLWHGGMCDRNPFFIKNACQITEFFWAPTQVRHTLGLTCGTTMRHGTKGRNMHANAGRTSEQAWDAGPTVRPRVSDGGTTRRWTRGRRLHTSAGLVRERGDRRSRPRDGCRTVGTRGDQGSRHEASHRSKRLKSPTSGMRTGECDGGTKGRATRRRRKPAIRRDRARGT